MAVFFKRVTRTALNNAESLFDPQSHTDEESLDMVKERSIRR
jgi:hypothetical protein